MALSWFMYRCCRIPCRHVELTSSLATGSMNRISFFVQTCYLHSVRAYMNFSKCLLVVSSSQRESCLTEPRPYHPIEQDRKEFSCLIPNKHACTSLLVPQSHLPTNLAVLVQTPSCLPTGRAKSTDFEARPRANPVQLRHPHLKPRSLTTKPNSTA